MNHPAHPAWRRAAALLAACGALAVAASGCGEKSEPTVHPPTTATPTVTVPTTTAPPATTTQPAPPATQTTKKTP